MKMSWKLRTSSALNSNAGPNIEKIMLKQLQCIPASHCIKSHCIGSYCNSAERKIGKTKEVIRRYLNVSPHLHILQQNYTDQTLKKEPQYKHTDVIYEGKGMAER